MHCSSVMEYNIIYQSIYGMVTPSPFNFKTTIQRCSQPQESLEQFINS